MKTVRLSAHTLDDVAAQAVEILQENGVAVLPFDTSYGLAADAASPAAVKLVAAIKGRPEEQALSVVVNDRVMAERYAAFNPAAARLWDRFMPGPLTIVLPAVDGHGLATAAGDGTIGFRHPASDFLMRVVERTGRPFTATSANRTGQPPAYVIEEFVRQLPDDGIAPHLVVDAGELPIRPPSTVVRVTESVDVLREGAIPAADIMKAANP